jgi:hypothetical protein
MTSPTTTPIGPAAKTGEAPTNGDSLTETPGPSPFLGPGRFLFVGCIRSSRWDRPVHRIFDANGNFCDLSVTPDLSAVPSVHPINDDREP